MRVLHCIWRMSGGGAEQQLIQFAGALASRDLDVHVVTVYPGRYDERLAESGATPHRITALGKYDPLLLARFAGLCRRLRPDVVQTWLTQMDILGGGAATLLDIPWILMERSVGAAYPPSLLHRARAALGRHATVIVANSEGGRLYWRQYVTDDARLRVIFNIAPVPAIEDAPPAALGVELAGEVILCVGRLSAEKNLDRLLDALALVLTGRSATVVFCGEGPLRTTLENRALALGIADRVVFCGFVTNVWSWMKRASVMVNVSVFEGSPNAVLEAIACATPVVVSDIPGHRDLVDSGSAWIVDPTSIESIKTGVLDALNNRAEAGARAARARQVVALRSADETAAHFETIYRGIAHSALAEVVP